MVLLAGRPAGGPRRAAAPARRDPVRAQRLRACARQVPRPRRLGRGLAGRRRDGAEALLLGRRAGGHRPLRSRSPERSSSACATPPSIPATHFVIPGPRIEHALREIQGELDERVAWFEANGKLLEGHRLRQRTLYDMEMLRELGFCNGVENYSRILAGKPPGAHAGLPARLLPGRLPLLHRREPHDGAADRRHVRGRPLAQDHAGRLRLPPAERPGQPAAALRRVPGAVPQIVFVSATPGLFELRNSLNIVEQVIRPTGLVDPVIEVRPTEGQIDDLMNEVRRRVDKDERVLVTTLTKRMAEDLTDYLIENGFRARYLHSEIDTLERIQIVRQLQAGRVRRTRGHQPAARGSRPARGHAGRHPGRRQGRLPARPDQPDPDHRPRGAQHRRHGDHVRRPHDRLHADGHRGDRPPSQPAGEVQRGARHHAAEHRQGRLGHRPDELRQPHPQQARAARGGRGRTLRHADAPTCRS